jgi:uncharacterized protein (DUF885 family)
MISALPQFKQLVSATPEASIYYTPITKLPGFSDADKQRLTAAYRKTINDKLMPALARLATFLEKEYVPACRTSTGPARCRMAPPGIRPVSPTPRQLRSNRRKSTPSA